MNIAVPVASAEGLRTTTRGAARLSVACAEGRSAVAELYFAQPLRILTPKPGVGEALTAVIANLSGGIVGGDSYETAIDVGAGARLSVAAQAAEKVYRSTGAEAENRLTFRLGDGAVLEWLPQGTILFDRAIFRQSVQFELAGSATLLAGAISVLGRTAMGETVSTGRYREHWDMRRDGKLIWADRFDLRDAAAAAGPASAMRGVSSFATALFARADAAGDLEWARETLAECGPGVRAGVTAIDDHLLAMRWLGGDAMRLREAVGGFWSRARARWLGRPERLPVIWRI
ncbi:MAG: urease accessory protein UreD [Nisaea sp.]|uniref:urease accessory protein UreD n=1 Tax=Nisaea sp. TaxID=2024842 RepID=UPI001B167E19|nr:urease accessory protein UreD [Nisaea sp.]MBO6559684.1 urease accessory protein UreD [Nisaea sp.]